MKTACSLLAGGALFLTAAAALGQAQQAVVVQGQPIAGRMAVREEVDPADPTERLLLLWAEGPVVLELSITLGGQPFRMPREALVDRLLEQARRNGNGEATWDAVLDDPRPVLGRPLLPNDNPQTRKAILAQWDTNGNGQVERREARRLVAMFSGGDSFAFTPMFSAPPDVAKRLDADGDGVLSADEIAAAGRRLGELDRDENEILDQVELAGDLAVAPYGFVGGRTPRRNTSMWLLGPAADWAGLHGALVQRYGKDEKLTTDALAGRTKLGAALDADGDGVISVEELSGLSSVPPHLRLSVCLDESAPAAVKLDQAAEALALDKSDLAVEEDSLRVALAGLDFRVQVQRGPASMPDFSQAAAQTIRQYDKDNNGYIEPDEFPQQSAAYLRRQFDAWDRNGDGKVFAEELKAYYEAMREPAMTVVRAVLTEQGNSLLGLLDIDGDGRLGLREVRQAADRLATLDADGDGRIAPQEIPAGMTLRVLPPGVAFSPGRVAVRGGGGGGRVAANRPQDAPGESSVPEWFRRMDRNGDGDLSPREFLGTPEQFRRLDRDGDGLVDAQEAAAP